MVVNLKKARDFVFSSGVLWERDLFAYHFGGDLSRVHPSLRAHRNADGGYGNALEHDIRCSQSNPLALEFLLTVLLQNDLPASDLLDTASAWCEANRNADGSFKNPPEVLDYPHAPWWNEGGQSIPDSITGLLIRYGKASDDLRRSTAAWVAQNLTPDHIRANDWLFIAYHAYDYFTNETNAPNAAESRRLAIENIVALAATEPERRYHSFFRFAPTPDSPVALAMPPDLLNRMVDYLYTTQQEDGGWVDEHNLAQWRAYVTITNLLVLRRFNRL